MGNHLFDRIVSPGRASAPFLLGPNGDLAWSYGTLRERVARIAGALVASGVRPGDRVAARIAKSPEGLMLYLGVVAAGAAFLPLNTGYALPELAFFLGDAQPALIVCDPAEAGEIGDLGVPVLTLGADGRGSFAEAADAAAPVEPVTRDAADLAAILYTSGTTGRSKGAMITHGNLVSNAEALVAIWRFTEADRLLHALPIYHTHGLFTACNTVLAAGASMLFLPRFEPDEVLAALPRATAMMGVPTFYTRLLGHQGLTREAAADVRLFISGSAPLLLETHHRFAARTGYAILERYGMTETGMNTSNPYEGERRPGSVGLPLPSVNIRVVNSEGAEMAAGEVGSIEVRGPNVFPGYWRDPEKTAQEFRPDGFFVTGDLGTIDAQGYLHISGRGKDLVISGGFNVYPKEVELVLDGLEGIVESAVIGAPHRDLGEGVVAVIVPADGLVPDEAALRDALGGRLARYKLPKRVIAVDELPRNSMGKVQKAVLRERFRDIFEEGLPCAS